MFLVQAHVLRTCFGGHLLFQYGYGTFQLCHLCFGIGKLLFALLLGTGLGFLLFVGEFAGGSGRSTRSILSIPKTLGREGTLGSLFRLMHSYPVIYSSKVFAHLASAKLVDTLHEAVEEIAVVAHDYHRAVEIAYGLLQNVLGFEVEVVGGLVEDEQVYGFQQQFYHGQTGALASGKELHLLLRSLATEHEGSQYVAYLQADVATRHTVDGVEHGKFAVQHLCLVLCKVTYLHIVAHLHFAVEGYLVHDALHHGGLSLAVLAHEGNLLATLYGEVHLVKDNMVVLLACLVADDGIVATSLRTGELQVQSRVVHLVYLHGDNLLQLAYALLNLYGLGGLIAEPVDEGLCVGNLFLLILEGTELLLAALGTKVDVLVVLHTIVIYPAATNLYGAVRYVVYKGTVMAHQHHGTRVGGKELLQPLY